ncbi:MAG: 30S ribosomal protein S20, partial [Actinomycetota bacterium]|nr:30S ribosomal protein S20 [Actinomycetota bacterium]
MANIKGQIKRNRQNEKRRLRNKGIRSEINSRVKTAIKNAESGA